MKLFFRLHVIPSRKPLDWTSPRSLLTCTLLNHLIQDQAPIGHFFVEFESASANAHGVKKVLTGMSRLNANQSTLAVIKQKVGLGTFFYDFEGKLDDSGKAIRELKWAKKKNRLKTISVEISNQTSELLMNELDQWIRHGSFRHYSGGLAVLKGEGSGCAEFGAHFLNLALGFRFVPREWIRSVYAPNPLTGGHRTGRKVGLLSVFLKGTEWAKSAEDGVLYETPDMDLTWNWLEKRYPKQTEITLNLSEKVTREPEPRISFEAGYAMESDEQIKTQWKRVAV